MQLLVSKWHYIVLPLIWVACLVAILGKAQQEAGNTASGRVRVLVIQDSSKQQVLEEASNLSLDLPVREHSDGGPSVASSEGSDTTSQPLENSTSSIGYRQFSVNSLTLHQQQHEVIPGGVSRAGNGTNLASEPQQQQEPWTELHLARQRPTWLNVSARYKITGTNIEELPFMFPAEYLIRRAFDSPILLRTKLGIIEGVRSIKFNKNLYTFLSIPYAKPPVGELRFKAPVPPDAWIANSIYQATKWPPFCAQPSLTLASKSSPVHVLTPMMSEDCLYLNIWSPSLKFNKNHKRPVMVWIHGGAFQYGGISVDENDGSALALLGDVVVVTLNYRLGAFGFLNANNPQNAPNNVGMQDQQLALQWVQDNIRQFGGDPQQVTLFGESAGGHSVGLHMISPRSHPMFKRAIMQSGVPVSFLRSYDANSDNDTPLKDETVGSVMMARRLKCYQDEESPDTTLQEETTTGLSREETTTTINNYQTEPPAMSVEEKKPILSDAVIECMRNKSSLEILKALGKPGNAGFFPTGNDANGVFPSGPIMDSFDPDNLKVGPQKDYLIGVNSDEGTFMLHYGMPRLFPSKTPPKISNFEELKVALTKELEQMMKESNSMAEGNSSAVSSASGGHSGGAHAHLIKPLMRTSSSMLESFLPKPKRQDSSTTNNSNSTSSSPLSINAEFGNSIGSLITDIIFVCPARSLAKTLSESNRNVYFYLYKHRSSLSQYHEWMGVTHHDEVEFVFGRPLRLADVYSGKDIEMSQRIIKAWAHFAYTGKMPPQLGTEWPKFGAEDNNFMILDSETASVGERYHDRMCNVYDTVISAHLQEN